jgi:GNAT superfamily N-acetyltransferase
MVMVRRTLTDDPALSAWCELFRAGHEEDSGNRLDVHRLLQAIRTEDTRAGVLRWWAWRDGAPIGVAQLRPGRAAGFLRLYVPEHHRRRGAGTALLSQALSGRALLGQALPGQAPRGLAIATVRTVVTAGAEGEAFAIAVGARPVLRLVEMTRHPAAGAAAPSVPPGYHLELWRDAAPGRLLASYAAAKAFIADAPGSSWQVDARWTATRVRGWEASLRTEGRTAWGAALLAGDDIVALTEISTDDGPAAAQHDTVVLPGHRRLGLGTAVKAALGAWLRRERPDLTSVTTTVSAGNTGMIAVNGQLGYRVTRHRVLVEITP